MEHDHIKSGDAHIRFRECPDCHQLPAITFDPPSQEFKISCCGYVVENAEFTVARGLWNDFIEEKISMEYKKEKEPNVAIAPCPKCGKVPSIRDISDTYDDQHMISCCGVSKVLDGCIATIESWNDYCAEHQLKTPAERSQVKISEVVENLRKILIAKNKNYGNSVFQTPALLPDLPAEKAIFVRMSDKVARLASLASGEKDRVGESIEDTLLDLAGYCVLAIIAMEEDSK